MNETIPPSSHQKPNPEDGTTIKKYSVIAKTKFHTLPIEGKFIVVLSVIICVISIIWFCVGFSKLLVGRYCSYNPFSLIFAAIFLPIALNIYFIPYWIALKRNVAPRLAIFVLMLVSVPLDVAAIGEVIWLGCLIWALAAKNKNESQTVRVIPAVATSQESETPTKTINKYDEISKLGELKDKGLITEEEFLIQKTKILNR